MEIKGIHTDKEGLVKLLDFLHGEENTWSNETAPSPRPSYPVYCIDSLKSVKVQKRGDISLSEELKYEVSLRLVDEVSRGKVYDDRVLQVVCDITLD